MPEELENAHPGEFIVYRSEDGLTEVYLRAVDGTVWLTQAQMGDLFGTSRENIVQHLKNVYAEGELQEGATCKDYLQVRQEGTRLVRRSIPHYNLDAVLAVGYRVRSPRGTQFRAWASTVLSEYLVKGFAMNDAKLKDPSGMDYFDELLRRIREIRASEKRFYQKVKDIFTTAVDYDPKSPVANTFFATVQNKVMYAVTGKTAAALVLDRADPDAPNMGLTTWSKSKVLKTDVVVAKNYLTEPEAEELNRLSTMYLDFAEDRARNRQQMTMADWAAKTDAFLEFNDRAVLHNAGSVSRQRMETEVHRRYEQFNEQRKQAEAIEAEREHLEELEQIQKTVGRGGFS